ncbi:response regulator transcription factor [Paenibacillus sp. RC67]|uniref:winged helix-turn-helix transcriptional regulator n=1 Tax=Paenibacillus sp. RC67 TaxID=3039392 RepID=UPI0024ACDCB7|nr:response regulator transcription factor [Paenibacillus sp. RC67]
MQQQREVNEWSSASIGASSSGQPIGAFCSTTHTIVLISPFPHALHELVRELTAKCYDVLVFHHLEEQSLAALPIDLLIVDATYDGLQPKARPTALAAPAILLVRGTDRLMESTLSSYDDALLWSSAGAQPILERIQSMLLGGGRMPDERVDQVQHKELLVDYKRMAAYLGAVRIDLTKTEFDLLKALLETNGAVLSRQELMDRVWGDQYYGGSNTVDVHVKSLRQKLKDNPKAPTYIETVRGVGYRLAD